MSTVSLQGEFEFWEFVNCGICHLEYIKESGGLSTTPFWLTECGHVVCNSHLKADHSCAECGSLGVQVMPLAKEMEPPMSNWFESVTLAFDAVGYTLRFQINTLSSLVRYFRKKYMQYRPLYDRLKEEHAETKRLRKMVDELKQENHRLKSRLQAYGDHINENNKRQRVDVEGGYVQHGSSPHSVTSVPTPSAPERLTLPPGQPQPQLNSRQPLRTFASATPRQPLSQYAYAPPRSAQPQMMAAPILSHAQSGSLRHAQGRGQSELAEAHQSMPPPPVPVNRLADVRDRKLVPTSQSGSRNPESLPQRPPSVHPSTPQPSTSTSFRFVPQSPMRGTASGGSSATSRTFIPGPHYDPEQQVQRFLPLSSQQTSVAGASSSGSVSNATVNIASRPSRSPLVSGSTGQRVPFIPGTAGT